ncbi:hypothetical protein VNO78_23061 [Psophocarpus tetragonolobus]|uniref:Myb-related protein 123 n=1 Tax=Psophocarpus tetragonolobus TaxID=3891 RepID=A0AAN9S3T8_PSOTE
MGRRPCCSKEGLNRGAWTAHEDKILKEYIKVHGEGRWRNLPKRAGLKRCGKSCRLRWLNYLRPDIKRGNISSDEEELIIRLHKLLGNRWSLIAGRLPGRTDNEIKNYWNTNLGKKVKDGNQSSSCSQNPMATVPIPRQDSNVVRAKASKCSKVVFINPKPQMQMQMQMQIGNTEAETAVMEGSGNDNGFVSFPNGETDMLIDFNVGDVCLSELLNEELLPDGMFSDELLKEWAQTNFADQDNASTNLHSLISFLESTEETQTLGQS